MRAWDDGNPSDDVKQLQAVWGALCDGHPTPLTTPKHRPGGHGSSEEKVDPKLLAVMETARVEKHVKSKLAVAAAHFNRDYKKGFQFLQVCMQLVCSQDRGYKRASCSCTYACSVYQDYTRE